MSKKLEEYVVTIPDFPEPGIMFRDITSVIQDPDGLKLAIDGLADLLKGLDFDLVVGPESRGFIFGVPVAYLTGKGFIPVRKKGKLPRETVSQKYVSSSPTGNTPECRIRTWISLCFAYTASTTGSSATG